MTFDSLLFTIENNIALITINRPDKLNALNKQVFNDLDKAADEVIENAAIKSAIITGSGSKAFVAGADITEFAPLSIVEAKQLSERGQQVFLKIENSPKPFVAAVNGFALGGGCELAMSCHFRLCSENAKFGQPEVNLGLIPGYGGTQRLTQLIGKGKSMELQMTAQLIDAQEALRLGLVNYVTTQDELLTQTKELLATINNKAPLSIAKIIECVNYAATSGNYNGFENEVEAFGFCFGTQDMIEGTSAFLEKRKAEFKGK
ncbi:MAG TPA: enoyl-CoA hydratase-related protein [Ferruginibacter sp.]|nr:enoyl-CoA hydratase-related protein [Ferruginibacter sp.]